MWKTSWICVASCLVLASCGGSCQGTDTYCTSNGKKCISMAAFQSELDSRMTAAAPVGYAFVIGGLPLSGSGGQARTSIDPPATAFTQFTPINVASVSKTITGVAVVKALDDHVVTSSVTLEDALDLPIGPYLPTNWSPTPAAQAITFRQLLTHTSGLHYCQTLDDGTALDANDIGYAALEQIVESHLDLSDKSADYANANFALFRIILPYVIGGSGALSESVLADAYIAYVQANVLDPAGVTGVDCKPDVPRTLAYTASGTTAGENPGDSTLECGSTGWNLSADDLWRFLLALESDQILTADERAVMEDDRLGWNDDNTRTFDGKPLWHNGYLFWNEAGGDKAEINTVIAVFKTNTYAAVVANSPVDVSDILFDAYDAAETP